MVDNETHTVNGKELESNQKHKVFIGSLSYQIEESVFRDYWTQFGTVLEATILRDRDGHSRGFGFVTFADSASVEAVMQARPHTLDNRVVETKRAMSREASQRPNMQQSVKKIYLGGVKEPLTETDLNDYFSKYGTITETIIMKDRDGQYRGYGFLEFDDYDSVDRVILERTHLVCGRPINVQKAQVKDGSQRSGQMRSRPGSSFMPSSHNRQNFNDYSPNYFNDSLDSAPNNNYRGYGSNSNQGNDGSTPFGQEYQQDGYGGPMRRGNVAGGGRGYTPYQGRGNGDRNAGSSWASWT